MNKKEKLKSTNNSANLQKSNKKTVKANNTNDLTRAPLLIWLSANLRNICLTPETIPIQMAIQLCPPLNKPVFV